MAMQPNMNSKPRRPVLLTGASGELGRQLAVALADRGWCLRLTDIAPFPGDVPGGSSFERADLADSQTIARLGEGCGAILHFGGISRNHPFDQIVGPNLIGVQNIYETAKREGARVVFASSNHAVGFHERSPTIDIDAPLRPDCAYGLSKAYGELMARLYWDKHGVESVLLRIGTSVAEPWDLRTLATWLSYADLVRLVECSVAASDVACSVIWAASRNAAMTWWGRDDRDRLGWQPVDSSDSFAARVAGKFGSNSVSDRYIGGDYCAADYSRDVLPDAGSNALP